MVKDTALQAIIDKQLIADNLLREEQHEPSGLLSASWLYQPLRFQVMKTIGIPRKQNEPYVLGKFRRGEDCEEYLVNQMIVAGILIERQKQVRYRNTVGLVDAVVDSNKLFFKKGVMPHEIKSVTNAKLKRINSTEVDYHYKLQGCFYAMAMKSEFYAIDILSAEDLRVDTYIFATKDLEKEIDQIITNYDKAIEEWNTKKILPPLVVNEKVKWAVVPEYAPFDEKFLNMTDSDIVRYLAQ